MRYNNYHKHSHYSNIFTPDTYTRTEDYCKRAIELGHDRVFTTEHGYGGDVFNAKDVCDSFSLKCIFGAEGYIALRPEEKDPSNYHIFISPKNNDGRRKLNKIISKANRLYYYYKPRFHINDLLGLDMNGFILTTACTAGIVRDEDGIKNIFLPLLEHFRDNMYLEIQSHNHPKQIEHNKKVLELSKKYDCKLISANDSHYIYPEDSKTRIEFLNGKGINYGDEDSFVLDYPSYDELIKRYKIQGVFSEYQVEEAIKNTLVFDECDEVDVNKTPKMPTLYPEKTTEEKYQMLEDLAYEKFMDIVIEDGIKESDVPKYLEKLNDCLKVVHDTEAMNTEDYFLIDQKIVEKAVDEYGGVLTRTGRGSAGAFYLNRVLGLTQLDSYTTDIPMYPDRFMSTARILENKSFPDIDLNVVSQEPFVRASKDLLGEFGCVPMLAFGTMQISESFRNKCRSLGTPFEEFNPVAKDLDKYREHKKWKPIIEEAEKLVDVIISGSVHPCAHALFNGDLEEEIGCVRLKDNVCCIITSDEADSWKYLKNDYLIVTVWDIIDRVFKEIGRPIMSLRELRDAIDDDVWKVYELGLTCTVNQVDSDWGTSLSMRYKPHSIDEVAKLTAAIRPSFDPWRENFITRKPYTNHNKYMDELLEPTDHYILFQENIMQYFEWLGVSPSESIGLIKKISKKKIKESDFKKLEQRILKKWIENTGSEEGFYENWKLIQSCMSYGFNCIAGSTVLKGISGNNKTISEMWRDGKSYHSLSMTDDGEVVSNKIVKIQPAGIADVYEVTTESGKTVLCTKNHRFPTNNGLKELQKISDYDYVYITDFAYVGSNVKKEHIFSIKYVGRDMTYDVLMNDPWHNFIVDSGIVVSNSPHAIGYGYDSVYGAYLKSHYPVQYFAVALNLYQDDQERTSKLVHEMSYYRVSLKGIKFRNSRAEYSYNLESREIYKGMASIKYMNSQSSEELYALRDNNYNSFTELLSDICSKTSLESDQLNILIKLDFFSEFGTAKQLLAIYENFIFFKKGSSKQISKAKITNEILRNIVRRNSRETEKNYMDLDTKRILDECEVYLRETIADDFKPIEKIEFQNEYLGYVDFSTGKNEDRFRLVVTDIKPLLTKDKSKVWARTLCVVALGTGKRKELTVYERYFSKNRLIKGDVIKISPAVLEKKIWNGRENWYLNAYRIE